MDGGLDLWAPAASCPAIPSVPPCDRHRTPPALRRRTIPCHHTRPREPCEYLYYLDLSHYYVIGVQSTTLNSIDRI